GRIVLYVCQEKLGHKNARCCSARSFSFFHCSDPNICHCVCGDDHQWIISCTRNGYLQNDCYPIWVCYAVDEYMAWCHGDLFLDPCIVDRRDPWSEYHHFFLDPDRI